LGGRRFLRFVLLAGLVVLFVGAIAYSAASVRYSVLGEPQSELTLTKLSLTHLIERAKDGTFVAPAVREQENDKACSS
jgi:hypothetical protein